VFIAIIPFALWRMLYNRFPKLVAAHYNLNNNVDGYANPNSMLLAFGIINILIITVFYAFNLAAGEEIGRVRSINFVGVLLSIIISCIMCNYIFVWSFSF
jgi:uncharacterized membrane protein